MADLVALLREGAADCGRGVSGAGHGRPRRPRSPPARPQPSPLNPGGVGSGLVWSGLVPCRAVPPSPEARLYTCPLLPAGMGAAPPHPFPGPPRAEGTRSLPSRLPSSAGKEAGREPGAHGRAAGSPRPKIPPSLPVPPAPGRVDARGGVRSAAGVWGGGSASALPGAEPPRSRTSSENPKGLRKPAGALRAPAPAASRVPREAGGPPAGSSCRACSLHYIRRRRRRKRNALKVSLKK